MSSGIEAAAGIPTNNPLPKEWLGRADAPLQPPAWANVGQVSNVQLQCLQAQIAYDISGWDYNLTGENNELGRYQFTPLLLETYGLLVAGAYDAYGNDCVNYRHVWQPITQTGVNDYQNYFYNITSLYGFLNTTAAQEHLSYQYIVDLYTACLNNGAILETDTSDVAAGMIYVAWTLGAGTGSTPTNPGGTGAWAWRYNNIGNGINSYNSGRYAVLVLSR